MSQPKKKAAIFKATMQLITKHGFHGTPMSKVAKEAGVAAGTIYHYFDGKEDLINQLYGELKEQMGAALLNEVDTQASVKDQFFGFWLNLYSYFYHNPDEFWFLEQYANSPYISSTVREENARYYQPVIDFLAAGIEKGELRNIDLDLMVSLVYGGIVSTVKLALSEDYNMTDNMLNDAVKSSWDGARN
jgi:AcrR family transcriptional regulator